MARWSCRNAVYVAGALAVVGCLGGQTGDPGGSAVCVQNKVGAEQRVPGVSPADLARAFEGSHAAALRWSTKKPGDAGVRIPDDAITITVAYADGDGLTGCDDLSVSVTVDITTRDSGIHETGAATLEAREGSTDNATLHFAGEQVVVSATLQRSQGAVELSGSLQAKGTGLPGDTAQFPPPAVAGTGGSGGAP